MTDCEFRDNAAIRGGGIQIGMISGVSESAPSATLTHCKFIDNSASPLSGDGYGGGVWTVMFSDVLQNTNDIIFNNCLFGRNTAKTNGGGVYFTHSGTELSSPSFANTTIGHNTATNGSGGGIYHTEITPIVRNGILWGNTDSGGTDESAQIHSTNPGLYFADAEYTDWQGHTGGTGNIDASPRFADPTGGNGDPDDDFRIGNWLSPAINAGNDLAIPPGFGKTLTCGHES